jgi:hypothetical protein
LSMASPSANDVPQADRRRWQYSLGDLLLVTAGLAAVLATWRVFGGAAGPVQLGALIVAGSSILLSSIFARFRWPWLLGLVLWSVAFWYLFRVVPGMTGPRACLGVVAAGVFYLLAGLPVVIASIPGQKRWPWVLGALACVLVSVLVTRADPPSMLFIGAPVFVCYTAAALAWRKAESALLVIGLALVMGSLGVAVGVRIYSGAFLATSSPPGLEMTAEPAGIVYVLNDLLPRACVPVALLGAGLTLAALLSRRRQRARRETSDAS